MTEPGHHPSFFPLSSVFYFYFLFYLDSAKLTAPVCTTSIVYVWSTLQNDNHNHQERDWVLHESSKHIYINKQERNTRLNVYWCKMYLFFQMFTFQFQQHVANLNITNIIIINLIIPVRKQKVVSITVHDSSNRSWLQTYIYIIHYTYNNTSTSSPSLCHMQVHSHPPTHHPPTHTHKHSTISFTSNYNSSTSITKLIH